MADEPFRRFPARHETNADARRRRTHGPLTGSGMFAHASRALAASLDASFDAYDRASALRRFPRLLPETIASETQEAALAVLSELERALRVERAKAGQWSYDLNRHIGLLVAYRAEKARAERIARTQTRSTNSPRR